MYDIKHRNLFNGLIKWNDDDDDGDEEITIYT